MAAVVTAVAVAFEVGTIAAIATAVADVGLTMTLVGMVTGSKDLTSLGGTLALAGGVAGLANAAFGEAVPAVIENGIESGSSVLKDATTELADSTAASTSTNVDAALNGATSTPVTSGTDTMTNLGQAPGAYAGPNGGGAGPTGGNMPDPTLNATPAASTFTPADATNGNVAGAPSANPSGTNPGQTPGASAGGPNGAGFGPTSGNTPLDVQAQVKQALSGNSSWTQQAKDWFNKQDGQTKAMLIKEIASIPGGIQSQDNKDREFDLAQQRINQTTAINTNKGVASWGIVNSKRAV